MALCRKLLDEELTKMCASRSNGCYAAAAKLFGELIAAPAFPEFLTMPAYDLITAAA
jgi:hypothetical protein